MRRSRRIHQEPDLCHDDDHGDEETDDEANHHANQDSHVIHHPGIVPVFNTKFGLVEAAGVEPASEAASSGISTSVSGILVLAWRLLPTGSASASRGDCPTSGPWRPRGSDPVYVTPLLGPPD